MNRWFIAMHLKEVFTNNQAQHVVTVDKTIAQIITDIACFSRYIACVFLIKTTCTCSSKEVDKDIPLKSAFTGTYGFDLQGPAVLNF
jgi:hypothetical protein